MKKMNFFKFLAMALIIVSPFLLIQAQTPDIGAKKKNEPITCGKKDLRKVCIKQGVQIMAGTRDSALLKLRNRIARLGSHYGVNCEECPDPKDDGCDLKVEKFVSTVRIRQTSPGVWTVPPQCITVRFMCTYCIETVEAGEVASLSSSGLRSNQTSQFTGLGREESPVITDLYPNPTGGDLNIELAPIPGEGQLSYTVMNSLGYQVVSKKLGENRNISTIFSIHANDWSSGMYYLTVSLDGRRIAKKVFIKK